MPEDSLRDSIGKAIEKSATPAPEATTQAADTTKAADTTQAADATKVADTTQAADTTKVADTTQAADTTKAADTTQAADATKAKPAAEVPAKGIRAPESWKPAIREQHWAKLPVAVQNEIYRRERQIDEGLQAAAEARKGMEQVQGLFSQFKDVFEYEKQPPLQTVASLLNISKALRFAPGPQKAQLMAQVIHGFGVDLPMLDQALSMLVKPSDPATRAVQDQSNLIQQAIQREMAPMRELMQGFQIQRQQTQQQEQAAMQAEIQTFAENPANTHFEVVRDVMADILEAGAARGQKITLQDAYKRAILANNDLAGQFSQQQLAEATQRASAPAAQAASLAAMSATGSPSLTGAAAVSAGNLREDLERAVARHSGRL